MIVHLKTVWELDGMGRYVKVYDEVQDYNGPVALACGATSQQKQIGQQQQNFFNQLQSQASTVFGNASQVFQTLVNTFTPTIQAGPNQQGFSPAELSAMQSQAITNVGQGYRNVKAAVGNQEAAYGGGNISLPTGVNEATDLGAAEAAANAQSGALNQITQENYAVGRQNYENAVKGIAGATDVFNPATSSANAATGAGTAAANTANQVAQENQSWMSAVSGVLGSVAGAATGGAMNWVKGLGGKQGGGGGGGGAVADTGGYGNE
jgi:hypothetical protein